MSHRYERNLAYNGFLCGCDKGTTQSFSRSQKSTNFSRASPKRFSIAGIDELTVIVQGLADLGDEDPPAEEVGVPVLKDHLELFHGSHGAPSDRPRSR